MSSPPPNHPFMRPVIQTTTPSPSSTLSQPSGTAYYRPMAEPPAAKRAPVSYGLHGGGGGSGGGGSGNGHNSYNAPDRESERAHSRAASAASNGRSTDTGHRSLPASVNRSLSYTPSTRGAAGEARAPQPNGHAAAGLPEWNEQGVPDPPRKLSRWEEKVQGDLAGWRGGHGVPQQSASNSTYYGQPTTGVLGKDLPKEIVRVERDWSLGDICQFSAVFPLELEQRVTPAEFQAFIEQLNQPLAEAYSVHGAIIDNLIAVATWWTSLMWRTSHFEKELQRAEELINDANSKTFNPAGLNVLSPRDAALQYLEIEYY